MARAYIETKYKNLNQESQDREESQQKIRLLNARMDQMGIAESERDVYRQRVWQEVRRADRQRKETREGDVLTNDVREFVVLRQEQRFLLTAPYFPSRRNGNDRSCGET